MSQITFHSNQDCDRAIAEELWPWVNAPPSTPIGEAEASWLATKA